MAIENHATHLKSRFYTEAGGYTNLKAIKLCQLSYSFNIMKTMMFDDVDDKYNNNNNCFLALWYYIP